MKKIKFNKQALISIVSGLLVISILGTIATVFLNKSPEENNEIPRDLISSIVAGQTGLGIYANKDGSLNYDYGDKTLASLSDSERGFSTSSVEIDGADDWVSLKLDGVNEILNYGKSAVGSSSITFLAPTGENGAIPSLENGENKYVFETDIKWSVTNDNFDGYSGGDVYYIRIAFTDLSNDRDNAAVFGVKNVGNEKMYFSNQATTKKGRCVLDNNEWYNLRIEYYYSIHENAYFISYYLDNILVSTYRAGKIGTFTGVNVSLRQKVTDLNVYFDNTYVGCLPR